MTVLRNYSIRAGNRQIAVHGIGPMVARVKIVVSLLADAAGFVVLLCRPAQSVQAENLFLRRQLALLKERGVRPRRAPRSSPVVARKLAKIDIG